MTTAGSPRWTTFDLISPTDVVTFRANISEIVWFGGFLQPDILNPQPIRFLPLPAGLVGGVGRGSGVGVNYANRRSDKTWTRIRSKDDVAGGGIAPTPPFPIH